MMTPQQLVSLKALADRSWWSAPRGGVRTHIHSPYGLPFPTTWLQRGAHGGDYIVM